MPKVNCKDKECKHNEDGVCWSMFMLVDKDGKCQSKDKDSWALFK